jgi:hypothetical protein
LHREYFLDARVSTASSGALPGGNLQFLIPLIAAVSVAMLYFWASSLSVATNRHCETSSLRRITALACISLVLLLAGLEATHAHSDVANVRSSPCAICLSVHANAPAVMVLVMPTLAMLDTLVTPSLVEGHGIQREISLFIRPPPAL